ncbi:anthocyanin 5-aromatic acyltransferase-like [Heracleum sosnowskyi]|uniref:Anthocyanin 5-aromatic acyltransferase-like n=1 Tax=Heracleum sosnowskyi TaxID=360622 RepID=A0AAD8IXE1_9APIA|nr:anthocyanin 5-aromatic acyltransferase-like [Heracleum sosnowskyi]
MENLSASVTVLEQCGVSPPPDAVIVTSLPLPFFDLIWLTFHPFGRVILYDFPCSTDHFIQHIVPNLKTSLSLALKHFTPLAGKLSIPSNADSNTDCQIRYLDGDSVSVTFAECTGDLDHFLGNHVRDAKVLKPLVPQFPAATTCIDDSSESYSASPVFAIQITVFPNRAICIGITNSHVVADGNTVFNFVRAWASFAKQLNISDGELNVHNVVSSTDFQIPYYDRSSIKDPHGLGAMLVKALGPLVKHIQQEKEILQGSSDILSRATFVLTEANIKVLKNIVSTKRPNLTYVSSFTVICAYLWTCFAKTRATVGKEVHNLDEAQNFGFVMDCRARLDPPLPASYFGNCLVPCVGVQTGRVMVGDEGLAAAAEVLGNSIAVKLKEGPLHSSDKWMEEFGGVMRGEWNIGIAGSPKLDYYNNIDFGWGKPLKFEFVEEPLSLSRCKDSKADIEIGVILPKTEMDVFSTVFTQGLHGLDG